MFDYFLWHCPLMAQLEQPQPQEDLPCFLSFTRERTASAASMITTEHTAIVPQLAEIHPSMSYTFTVSLGLPDSL